MDTNAQAIVKEIADRLDEIKEANGFAFDLLATRGRRNFEEQDLCDGPVCSVWISNERMASSLDGCKSRNEIRLRIELHRYVTDRQNPGDAIHELIGAVKQAVFISTKLQGATNLEYVGFAVNPPGDGSDVISAVVEVETSYFEPYGNPWRGS